MSRKMIYKAVLAFVLMFGCVLLKGVSVDAAQMQTEKAQEEECDLEILIDIPLGYFKDQATVTFKIEPKGDKAPSITAIKARTGKKGAYVDVKDSMSLVITEDCTVYVVATDENGKNYERSRAIQCFDKDKPTLNAAVSEGVLNVKAVDTGSGIKKIIVNGYEYIDLKDGELNIRLSQFDAGYASFEIQAEDIVGNLSEVYRTPNPYHKAEDSDDSKDPAGELPVSVTATAPGTAQALVTAHVITDENGNVIRPEDLAGVEGEEGENSAEILVGKEFYTITTASNKNFYLIVDRLDGREQVLFLTEVSENDLLNVTSNNSQSLPRNSAAVNSGIEIKEAALPNNNVPAEYSKTKLVTSEELEKEEQELAAIENPTDPKAEFLKKNGIYIGIGGVSVFAIIIGYYLKVVKKRRDAEEDEDDGEEYDNSKEEADN